MQIFFIFKYTFFNVLFLEKYLKMSDVERRKSFRSNVTDVNQIEGWNEYFNKNKDRLLNCKIEVIENYHHNFIILNGIYFYYLKKILYFQLFDLL